MLEEASLHVITTAEEATVRKEPGMVYYNKETDEIKVADTSNVLRKFMASSAALGDVKASILSEAQFTTEMGAGWTLADGKDVTGSDYHTLTTNTTIPDMRGQFLRGKNNGRVDGEENPDGDLAIGVQTTDKLGPMTITGGSHDHRLPQDGGGSSAKVIATGAVSTATPLYTSDFKTEVSSSHSHSVTEASNETAPKNVTVNYFIKINR